MKKSIGLFLMLLLPLLAAQMMQSTSVLTALMHLIFSLSLTVLLNSAQHKSIGLKRVFKTLLMGVYFTYVFMLLFEGILFDFTGNGFTHEVYFHFELESLRIGFNEYPVELMIFLFLMIFYIFLINKLISKAASESHYVLTAASILGLLVAVSMSSLVRFSSGLIDYHWQSGVEVNAEHVKQYAKMGVLQNTTITKKNQLIVKTHNDSKNLILLYLESFNAGLLNSTRYPELTPNLDHFSSQNNNFNHLSSSYVTIEGIISSQCGIMLPMSAGSNTFLNEGRLLSDMPCLGDVLHQAGYSQYYLGGAQMEFAGKGRFLENHGYNHIWGLEYWKSNDFKIPKGEWGLSDNVLFENAINTIKMAAKAPPYNVTLLTLGTHVPGFIYDGCKPYQHSDELFIKAIHCTDQLVGKFITELEEAQLLDDAVLMIVGDHGVFPNEKMRKLFGELVDDKRLIGLTNQPIDNQNKPVSSYDLAPTLLDMLGIEHNAKYLFGQSHSRSNIQNQKHVTRLGDWHESKLIHNEAGQCNKDDSISWPLNNCQKKQLLSLTTQLLEYYSTKEQPEQLACEITIEYTNKTIDSESKDWTLLLNSINHFDHFYSNGFTLKTRYVNSGFFVFVLDDRQQIKQHIFFKHNEKEQAYFKSFMKNNTDPLLIIQTQINNEGKLSDTVSIEVYQNQQKVESKQTTTHNKESVNICA